MLSLPVTAVLNLYHGHIPAVTIIPSVSVPVVKFSKFQKLRFRNTIKLLKFQFKKDILII